MFFGMRTKSLSNRPLTRKELKQDMQLVALYGPCSLGRRALYMDDQKQYVPFGQISRLFKSKDPEPTLVVVYDREKEKVCRFESEAEIDKIMWKLHRQLPHIAIGA